MKQFGRPPFLREAPHSSNSLFLSNFFMTSLFVWISKTRNPTHPQPPNFTGGERKLWIVMIKNLFCRFCTNCQYSFILTYNYVRGEVCEWEWERGCEKVINKWNQGEIIMWVLCGYLIMWVMLVWGHFHIIIKWGWGNFFPET